MAGLNERREALCERCETRQESDRTKRTYRPPLNPIPLPEKPLQKITIDIKGPLNRGPWKYLIVVMDYYSKWPKIKEVNSITSRVIIRTLEEMFARLETPGESVSDNGRQLVAREVKVFLTGIQVQHRTVPCMSYQNGLVERDNRILGEKSQEAERWRWINIDPPIFKISHRQSSQASIIL